LGPLVFGAVSFGLGGNQRAAVLSVAAFFVAGVLLLQRVGAGGPPAHRDRAAGADGPGVTEPGP
jgi:hypothetical protein